MITRYTSVFSIAYLKNKPLTFLIVTLTFFISNSLFAVDTEIASLTNNSDLANGNSFDSSNSANGDVVAFESAANNLAANDANALIDVFVRNLQTNTTTLVSINSANTGSGNSGSFDPSISSDGNLVAFESAASDLVVGDGSGTDIFLRNLQTNSTTLLSMNSGNTASANGNSTDPSISADGRFVAFESLATDLVATDNNALADVYVRDLQNNTTVLVSMNSTNTDSANAASFDPSISADGRFVTYSSAASDLVAGDNNGLADIFVRDLQNNTTVLASPNSGSTDGGNAVSFTPDISADGQFVVFSSDATDLVVGDANALTDVFIRDLLNNTTTLASMNSGNSAAGNGGSFNPNISDDGRFVAFASNASDLVAGDINAQTDIFVRNLVSNTNSLVSTNGGPAGANNNSLLPSLSADGGLVSFESFSTNLVAGDINGVQDIFSATTMTATGPIVSATLPASRSVQVTQTGTAFASIINAGATDAINCAITPNTSVAADFSYQTTDAMNALTGTPNTRVDIAAGATQNFVLSFTPTAAFAPTDVEYTYDCANTDAAVNTIGLNTLLLSADTVARADIVALTTVVNLLASVGNTSIFAVGSANVGATSDITVSLDDGGQGLPLNMSICQTDAMGACIGTASPSVTFNYVGGTTASFAIFVAPTADIANDAANNRIFIRFADTGGTVRGATSTAVRTLP